MSTDRGPHTPPIHILDAYSLLNVFYLSRPALIDGNESDNNQLLEGGEWNRERWWYRLIQVCRRWRYIVLESSVHLRLALVCARGTPVADMLKHSPPLPIIIDHVDQDYDITEEDEEGIIHALQHRDRVRRIRLRKSAPILERLVNALDGVFPILDYLFVRSQEHVRPTIKHNMTLKFPETFRAPRVLDLLLMHFNISIGSPLLADMRNLVTLSLNLIPSSAYFHLDALLQRLSSIPQLKILGIIFNSPFLSRDIERQSSRIPRTTQVALPNLRWLGFKGTSAYLEALLAHVTVPLLEKLQVYFFNQLSYSIPHLQQSMRAAENLRIKTITLSFREDYLNVRAYPYKGAKLYTLSTELSGRNVDWQVASAAQVFRELSTASSAVEHLTLEHARRIVSSEWHNEADRTQWRELLGSFRNVKTLFVDGEFVGQVSCALQPDEGESPTELLPELQELSYSAIDSSLDVFARFIDARQKAGRPVTMIRP